MCHSLDCWINPTVQPGATVRCSSQAKLTEFVFNLFMVPSFTFLEEAYEYIVTNYTSSQNQFGNLFFFNFMENFKIV